MLGCCSHSPLLVRAPVRPDETLPWARLRKTSFPNSRCENPDLGGGGGGGEVVLWRGVGGRKGPCCGVGICKKWWVWNRVFRLRINN